MSKNRRHKPIRYYSPKRRAVYAEGDDIKPLILFELFNWKCFLCKKPIDKRRRCPDYWAATVEHLVPLSQGGKHEWSNVVPAHLYCNLMKGDSLLEL